MDGILNAITFTCQHSGKQTIIGKGAGGMETASSILRDLIDIRTQHDHKFEPFSRILIILHHDTIV